MRFALVNINTNIVDNVIMWDLAPWPQSGWMLPVRSDVAQLGDLYDPTTNTFTAP